MADMQYFLYICHYLVKQSGFWLRQSVEGDEYRERNYQFVFVFSHEPLIIQRFV